MLTLDIALSYTVELNRLLPLIAKIKCLARGYLFGYYLLCTGEPNKQ